MPRHGLKRQNRAYPQMKADLFTAYRRVTRRAGEAGWLKLSADERNQMIEAEFRAMTTEENGTVQTIPPSGAELLAAYLLR